MIGIIVGPWEQDEHFLPFTGKNGRVHETLTLENRTVIIFINFRVNILGTVGELLRYMQL